MMPVVPDNAELRRAIEAETCRIAAILRAGDDPAARVPGLEWTALDVAAHLAVALQAFVGTVRGEQLPFVLPAAGPGQSMPEFLAATNQVTIRDSPFSTLTQAGAAIEAAGLGMADVLRFDPGPQQVLPTPWYGPGQTRTLGTLAALSVTETLVHGYDIAGALGAARTVPVRSARSAAATVMSQMLPYLPGPGLSPDFQARYGIRIRGAQSFVLEVGQGQIVALESDGRDVDCSISLSATAALLVGFRRIPLWRAIARGGALSTGRRPWLAMRFGSVFQSA